MRTLLLAAVFLTGTIFSFSACKSSAPKESSENFVSPVEPIATPIIESTPPPEPAKEESAKKSSKKKSKKKNPKNSGS